MKSVAEYRKAVVAAIGVGLTLVSSALDTFGLYLSPEVTNVITGVVAVGTAVGVYLTKNADTIDHIGA